MPYKCCVPGCKGNYKTNDKKVSVFSFPKDEFLSKKWLNAIHRKDYTITKYSKVCELHFRPEEIERCINIYDEKTKETLSTPLLHPRLVADAVPSQMPGCPQYLSKSLVVREDPDKRRERTENEVLHSVLKNSKKEHEMYLEKIRIKNFNDLNEKIINCNFNKDWVVIQKENFVNILLIDTPKPKIKCYVQITENLISDLEWPLLTYISGYISHAVIKKFNCEYCKYYVLIDSQDVNISLISSTDRGGLCYPNKDVVQFVSYIYVTMQKLISLNTESIFLQQSDQRSVLISLSLHNIPKNYLFLGYNCLHHNLPNMMKVMLQTAANIFLNNYVKKRNDVLKKKSIPQFKRIKTSH